MPPKAPITIARNPNTATPNQNANAIVPVSGAALQNAANRNTRALAARLKLEIRRLPPGLTQQEFEDILGEEWKLGEGKVNWMEYRAGKTKSLGKIPEQSRCYLHLAAEAHLKPFEARFLDVMFHDAKGTHKLSDLKHLPPTLGFAPNQKVPPTKNRVDGRQGTIDQDPEYQAFLEAETMPVTKPAALDGASMAEKKGEKMTSTPLIDDLRERKANKAKAGAEKVAKQVSSKTETKDEKATQKTEEAAKEAAKALNKQIVKTQQSITAQAAPAKGTPAPAKGRKGSANAASANASPTTTAAKPAQPSVPASPKTRHERGNADGIKKMLQKDLGLVAKPSQGSRNQARAAAASKSTQTPTTATSQAAVPPRAKVSQPATTAAGALATTPSQAAPKPPPPSRKPPAPAQGAVKAYLKHANPSQGMTEVLISQSLAQFGPVINVNIDPRKGTAIATFSNTEGLTKAMEAKSVTVAQGAVEVMEFRDRQTGGGGGVPAMRGRGGHRSGGGGGRGGRGGGNVGAGSASAPSAVASTSSPVPAAPAAPPGTAS